MKKVILWLLGGGLLCAVAAVVGGNLWLQGQLSAEQMVQLIEKETNARAEIRAVHSSLLAQPAEVIVSGLQLAARDAECGKPLALRAALPAGSGLVNVERVTLRMSLLGLLTGTPVVELLKLEQVSARGEISKEGENSLALLFQKREGDTAAAAVVGAAAVRQTEVAEAKTAEAVPVSEGESVPAVPAQVVDAVVVPAVPPVAGRADFHLRQFVLTEGSLHLVDRQTKVKSDVSALQLEVADLAPGSDAMTRFTLSADLKQVGRARLSKDQEPQEVNYLTGKLTGEGKLSLLAGQGQWVPAGAVKLALAQGSVIAGYKTVGDKFLGDVGKYAPELSEMKMGGELLAPLVFELKLAGPRTEMLQTARAVTEQYEVQLRQGSWWDSAARGMETKLTVVVPLSVAGPAALLLPAELKSEPGKLSLPVTLAGPMDDFETRWLQ